MASSGIDVLTYAVCKAYVDKVAGGGGSSINVVQTTGSSTEDVMSQDATSKMVFQGGNHPTAIRIGNTNTSAYDNSISIGVGFNQVSGQGAISIGEGATCRASNYPVAIGESASATGDNTVAIGREASAGSIESVCIGRKATSSNSKGISIGAFAKTNANYGVAIGTRTVNGIGGVAIGGATSSDYGVATDAQGAVAIGYNSHATRAGEVNFGDCVSAGYGFNHSAYRVLGGVYDGQELHDVATVAQGNTLATSAPTTATVGVLGQFYTDTTAMHTYQCTAIDDTTDPDNPSYTWTQRW